MQGQGFEGFVKGEAVDVFLGVVSLEAGRPFFVRGLDIALGGLLSVLQFPLAEDILQVEIPGYIE